MKGEKELIDLRVSHIKDVIQTLVHAVKGVSLGGQRVTVIPLSLHHQA